MSARAYETKETSVETDLSVARAAASLQLLEHYGISTHQVFEDGR